VTLAVMRMVVALLALVLAVGGCASAGPFFPPDPTAFMPNFDRSDCFRYS